MPLINQISNKKSLNKEPKEGGLSHSATWFTDKGQTSISHYAP